MLNQFIRLSDKFDFESIKKISKISENILDINDQLKERFKDNKNDVKDLTNKINLVGKSISIVLEDYDENSKDNKEFFNKLSIVLNNFIQFLQIKMQQMQRELVNGRKINLNVDLKNDFSSMNYD